MIGALSPAPSAPVLDPTIGSLRPRRLLLNLRLEIGALCPGSVLHPRRLLSIPQLALSFLHPQHELDPELMRCQCTQHLFVAPSVFAI